MTRFCRPTGPPACRPPYPPSLSASACLQTVMMSSTKQAMLQSLLKDGFAAASGAQSGSSASAVPLDPAVLADVESQLLPMGFSQQQVRQAAAAVSGRAGGPTGSTSASDAVSELALDWLFIHLSADQMPRQYRTGESAVHLHARSLQPVLVLHWAA